MPGLSENINERSASIEPEQSTTTDGNQTANADQQVSEAAEVLGNLLPRASVGWLERILCSICEKLCSGYVARWVAQVVDARAKQLGFERSPLTSAELAEITQQVQQCAKETARGEVREAVTQIKATQDKTNEDN